MLHRLGPLIVLALLLSGCQGKPAELTAKAPAARPAWDERPAANYPKHPWEAALADRVIALDPGHGGDGHIPGYKRGPTGVREAAMNLRVGLFLRDFLEQAGATVVMTRTEDVDSTLSERVAIANEADADVFISLHHNAGGSPEANYTTVWHHGRPADAGPALDLARYVSFEITDALRTDAGKTSPVMSDFQMYAGGFGVLRPAEMPAVLTESSFFSHPEEEQRLADPAYNEREAYAIYRALAAYFRHGTPGQTLTLDGSTLTGQLDDGLPGWWGAELRGPLPDTVVLTADGERLPIEYDVEARSLTARLPAGAKALSLKFQNTFKHDNWPQHYVVEGGELSPRARPPAPTTRPAEEVSTTMISTSDDQPWAQLPAITFPVELTGPGISGTLDHGLSLPPGSALTIAKIDPATGELAAVRYDRTGDRGFYPASTVKTVTGTLLVLQLQDLGLTAENDIEIGAGERQNVGALLTDMIKDSGNDAYNDLAEVVGFAETRRAMDEWGATNSAMRRHFKRPRTNHSPEVRFYDGDKLVKTLPARPGVDFPLNKDGGESNLFTADDLVRVLAATFQGPARDAPAFGTLAAAMRETNERFLGRGLDRFGDRFVSYNKPGWWPPEGNNVDMIYIHDRHTGDHYYVGAYYQTEPEKIEEAQAGLADAMAQIVRWIDEGKINF
jgi:N-acetylmuramoyl-L-alanine amidase